MKPILLQIYTNKKFNIFLLLFETSTFQVFLKATSKCAFPRPSALFLNIVLYVIEFASMYAITCVFGKGLFEHYEDKHIQFLFICERMWFL